jgi:hypothetical protein
MNINLVESSVTKEIPLDADVDEILNGGGEVTWGRTHHQAFQSCA